jgi:hypothetical protein
MITRQYALVKQLVYCGTAVFRSRLLLSAQLDAQSEDETVILGRSLVALKTGVRGREGKRISFQIHAALISMP